MASRGLGVVAMLVRAEPQLLAFWRRSISSRHGTHDTADFRSVQGLPGGAPQSAGSLADLRAWIAGPLPGDLVRGERSLVMFTFTIRAVPVSP
jgi:hypothetical protein